MFTVRSCLTAIIGGILIFVGFGFLMRPFSQGGVLLIIPGIALIGIGFLVMFKKDKE